MNQYCLSHSKIPHTGDKASLDRCRQQHRCHRRVDQEYPKTRFFEKRKKSNKTQKLKKSLEICQNQRYGLRPEVSNLSGSVVSGWTKNTQKPNFFEKRKKSSKRQKLKNVQRYAKISDTPFNQRFPPCFVRQNQQKKTFFTRQFQTTSQQKCSNVRPLLSITFPQGFRISKNIGHPTLGSGGKKTVKRYLKSEQKHGRTDTRTDRGTFRLIESISPEGRRFENINVSLPNTPKAVTTRLLSCEPYLIIPYKDL